MTTTTIIRVLCPRCREDVLAEVRHVGRARRCECPWCGQQIRIPRSPMQEAIVKRGDD